MKYIIICPEQSTAAEVVFWRDNNAGHTTSPFAAGIYTKEQIEADPNYYNNGLKSLAIPLTHADMHEIGLQCSWKPKNMPAFLQSSKQLAKHIPQ